MAASAAVAPPGRSASRLCWEALPKTCHTHRSPRAPTAGERSWGPTLPAASARAPAGENSSAVCLRLPPLRAGILKLACSSESYFKRNNLNVLIGCKPSEALWTASMNSLPCVRSLPKIVPKIVSAATDADEM